MEKLTTNHRRWISAALLVLFVALAPSITMADARQRYKQQIDQFRVMLEQTAKLDTQKLAADDRADAIKWLEEAEVLLAKGDMDAVSLHVKRIEYAMELIQQMTVLSQIRGKALEQEKGFASSTEQLAKMKKQIETLKQQKAKIQGEINAL